MDQFWPTWTSFWLSMILALISLLYGIPQNSSAKFLEQAPVENLAARAVFTAYKIADAVFGRKIISTRAFFVSAIFSAAALMLTFAVTVMTTPGFISTTAGYLDQTPYIGAMGHFHRMAIVTTGSLILASLVAEYLYVAKSRLILRTVRFEASYWRLLTTIIADVATTLFIFILVTPITILVALYVLSATTPGVDLTKVIFMVPQVVDHQIGTAHFESRDFNLINPFSAYATVTRILFIETIKHAQELFHIYHALGIYPVVDMEGVQQAAKFNNIDLSSSNLASGFIFPTSTMLATAFATTIWVSITATLLMIVRGFCRTFVIARSFFAYLHRHPHVIFWAGILPSTVIFLIGSAIHLTS